MYALNAGTGAKLWSFNTGAQVSSSPAIANGVVYVAAGYGLFALNVATGALLWSYSTEDYASSSSPAVANGVVYFTNTGPQNVGNVCALNTATGALLWNYYLGDVSSPPAIVNGSLYIRGGYLAGNAYGIAHYNEYVYSFNVSGSADLSLRVQPSPTPVTQGTLLTYAFPVWNLGPANAVHEVLTTQVPEGTTLDYVRISGTPGLGTCTTPPYQGTGEIVCHANSAMAPNTTWTVRVVVKVTAPSGTVITESAATMSDTPDPNLANNTATVSMTVQ